MERWRWSKGARAVDHLLHLNRPLLALSFSPPLLFSSRSLTHLISMEYSVPSSPFLKHLRSFYSNAVFIEGRPTVRTTPHYLDDTTTIPQTSEFLAECVQLHSPLLLSPPAFSSHPASPAIITLLWRILPFLTTQFFSWIVVCVFLELCLRPFLCPLHRVDRVGTVLTKFNMMISRHDIRYPLGASQQDFLISSIHSFKPTHQYKLNIYS